jgi:hypothetical protein
VKVWEQVKADIRGFVIVVEGTKGLYDSAERFVGVEIIRYECDTRVY